MTNSILALFSLVMCNSFAAGDLHGQGASLAGQDLHLTAQTMVTCSDPVGGWFQAILLDGGVSIQVGDNLLSGRNAVLWLRRQGAEQTVYGIGQAYQVRV